jgi:hypothetical protein
MQSIGGDAATLNMSEVKTKSDLNIDNSHEDLDVFRAHVEQVLSI